MESANENRDKNKQHPLAEANFFSKIFFLYLFKSVKNPLDPENLYKPLICDRSELLGDRLERSWNAEMKKTSKMKKKCIINKCIFRAFWFELLTTAFISCIEVTLRIAEPICLGFVLSYFQPDSKMTQNEVLYWTIGMLCANGFRVIAYAQQRYHTLHTAMKIRVACSNLIYRKLLRLRSTTLQQDGGGKIVTLISNDLSRFDLRTELINYVYTGPIVVIAIVYIIYQQFGNPGLIGIGFIIIVTILQAFMAHYVSTYHLITAKLTDNRIKMMHSLLDGIQVIKMYAWENSFVKLIGRARAEELYHIGKSFLIKSLCESIYILIVPFSIFLALYAVINDHEDITMVMIFLMVIYYTLLNYMISIFFTLGVAKLFEIRVVLKRVNDFLLSEERQDEKQENFEESVDEVLIELENISASWQVDVDNYSLDDCSNISISSETTSLLKKTTQSGNSKTKRSHHYYELPRNKLTDSLKGISLKVEDDEFVGIIGPVGSGKSSLLQVILGELLISSGTKTVRGRISYCPQEAWTFASTIRQNILFGLEYDEGRYLEVIRVCGLHTDFQQFSEGDLTLVGDRGASLSGGQKARINLARALYRDADIYLLDDPFSAVDVAVANYLYTECLMNFLADKCRILVTHHSTHLSNADNIIYMCNGMIDQQGTYHDLVKSGIISDDLDADDEKFHIEKNRTFSKANNDGILEDSLSSTASTDSDSLEKDCARLKSLTRTTHDAITRSRKGGTLLFKYLLADQNYIVFICTILVFIVNQLFISGISLYLGIWSSIEETRDRFSMLGKLFLQYTMGIHKKMYYEDFLGYMVIFLIVFALLQSIFYSTLVKGNSQSIHDNLLEKIKNTNLRFFDTTCSGRILNRFSRDLGTIDESLPRSVMEATQIILMAIGSFLLLIIVDLDFIIPTVILNVLFITLLIIFTKYTRQIKRAESRMVGPILTHVNNSARGITTIKALSAGKILTREFEYHQDNYSSSWFLYGTSSIALSFYVDLSCFLYLLYIALILIFYAKSWNISEGFVGMALTQAMSLTGVIQYGIRQTLEANNLLIAVERIFRYENLQKEEDPDIFVEPPAQWPDKGRIVFEEVGLRYDPDLPLVLKNLNFVINPKEKIGIVGRTGAGKSSIMAAIFRLCIVEGSIEIDGFDTRDIPLQLLRSKIAVIPQDPILFGGTLRFNLDPFNEYDDNTLYKVVHAVDLKDPSGLLCTLDYQVSEGGSNYSVGQRQLICLARALIRKNKILLLDEATANIDPGTDAIIQKTIKRELADCTVLTVAHRLNTVMDSDKVMVMEEGEVIEFDHPHILLQNVNGAFYNMVALARPSEVKRLTKTAFDNYIGWKG
ncbi:hypothetical protein HHI36_006610 [Cryptolaemus montrouzieri]